LAQRPAGTGQQATTTFDLLGHRGCYGSCYRSFVSDDRLSDRSWLFNYQRGNLGYNHCRSRFFNCWRSRCRFNHGSLDGRSLDSNGFRNDRGSNFCNHWLVDNRYLGFFSNYRFGYHWLCGRLQPAREPRPQLLQARHAQSAQQRPAGRRQPLQHWGW
jgi:hypothetical protein